MSINWRAVVAAVWIAAVLALYLRALAQAGLG